MTLGLLILYVFLCLLPLWSHNASSFSSTGFPEVCLIFACRSSLMTVELGKYLWVLQNIIRNQIIMTFFLSHIWFYPMSLGVSTLGVLTLQAVSGVDYLSEYGSKAGPVIIWPFP